jgi:protein gp37
VDVNHSLPKTDVPWADRQWPILRGCSEKSEGCKNCYSKTWHNRFAAHMNLPPWGKPHYLAGNIHMPAHTRKPCRVFVAPMSDLFHEQVETIWQDWIGLEMAQNRRHTFFVLTKRPEGMRRWVGRMIDDGIWPMPNVWLGVTAENQARYAAWVKSQG